MNNTNEGIITIDNKSVRFSRTLSRDSETRESWVYAVKNIAQLKRLNPSFIPRTIAAPGLR